MAEPNPATLAKPREHLRKSIVLSAQDNENMVKRKPLGTVDANRRKIPRKRCGIKKVDWSKVGVEYFSDDSDFTFLTDPKPIPKTCEKPQKNEAAAQEKEEGTFSTRKTPKISNCSNPVASASSRIVQMGATRPIPSTLSSKLPAKRRKILKASKKRSIKSGNDSVTSLGTIYEECNDDNESLTTSPGTILNVADGKLPKKESKVTYALESENAIVNEKENLFFQQRNEQDNGTQQFLSDMQPDALASTKQSLPVNGITEDDENSDMDESWGEDMLEMSTSPPDNELDRPVETVATTRVDCTDQMETTRIETVEEATKKLPLIAGLANFESRKKSDVGECSAELVDSTAGKNTRHRTPTKDPVPQEVDQIPSQDAEYSCIITRGLASGSNSQFTEESFEHWANNNVVTEKPAELFPPISMTENMNNLDLNDVMTPEPFLDVNNDVTSKHDDIYVGPQTFRDAVEIKSDVRSYKPDNEEDFKAIMAKEVGGDNKPSLVGMVVKTPAQESDTSSVDESVLSEEDFFLTDQKLLYQRCKQRHHKNFNEHELQALSQQANRFGNKVHFATPLIESRNDCQLEQAQKMPLCFTKDLKRKHNGTNESMSNDNMSSDINETYCLPIGEASKDVLNSPSSQVHWKDEEFSENDNQVQDFLKSQRECSNSQQLSSNLGARTESDTSPSRNIFGCRTGQNMMRTPMEHTTPVSLRKPAIWTAEQARRRCEALGTNIAPVFKLSDGGWFRHPVLPPGWTMVVSRTKNIPYYMHPDFGVTFYCPVPLPSDDGTVKGTTLFYCFDTPVNSLASGETSSESFSEDELSTGPGSGIKSKVMTTCLSTELEQPSPTEQSCIVDDWLQTPKCDEEVNESSKVAEDSPLSFCTREVDEPAPTFFEQQHQSRETPTVMKTIQTPNEEKEVFFSGNQIHAETGEKVTTVEYSAHPDSTIKGERFECLNISEGFKLQQDPMEASENDFVRCGTNEGQNANIVVATGPDSKEPNVENISLYFSDDDDSLTQDSMNIEGTCLHGDPKQKNTPSQIACIAFEHAQQSNQVRAMSPLESDKHDIFSEQTNKTAPFSSSSSKSTTCNSDPDLLRMDDEVMYLSSFLRNQEESPKKNGCVKQTQEQYSTHSENKMCNLTAVQIGHFDTDHYVFDSKAYDRSPVFASSLPVRVIFGNSSDDDDDISRLDGSPLATAKFQQYESVQAGLTRNLGGSSDFFDSQSLKSNSTSTSMVSHRALHPTLTLCALQNLEKIPRRPKYSPKKKKNSPTKRSKTRGTVVT